MIEVLEILDGGKFAIVSTKGLRRVVSHGPDCKPEIADELAEPADADAYVRGYTDPRGEHWAESIDYTEVFTRSQNRPVTKAASKLRSRLRRLATAAASLL